MPLRAVWIKTCLKHGVGERGKSQTMFARGMNRLGGAVCCPIKFFRYVCDRSGRGVTSPISAGYDVSVCVCLSVCQSLSLSVCLSVSVSLCLSLSSLRVYIYISSILQALCLCLSLYPLVSLSLSPPFPPLL